MSNQNSYKIVRQLFKRCSKCTISGDYDSRRSAYEDHNNQSMAYLIKTRAVEIKEIKTLESLRCLDFRVMMLSM